MKYPLRTDYNIAVKHLHKFTYDSVLKNGKPVVQSWNPGFLLSHNGGKAIVYEIQTNPKKYALKCWIEDLGDLKIRYKAIDEYLKKVQIPYFVDFAYHEQGIFVNGHKFPIVRMEWVDGLRFKKFISVNMNNPKSIYELAEKFLEMVKILHNHQISHGDLQHGNIMVRKNNDVCLVDYDSLYVPSLSNEKDNIKGLPGYQHPKRSNLQNLSPKADYFSELIIYLSLITLSENPHYWNLIEPEERLLFSEKDLINPSSSKTFKELKNLSPKIVYLAQELEKFCQIPNIENLEPLENLVANYSGSKISWDFVPPPNTSTTSSHSPSTVSLYPPPSAQGWNFTPQSSSPKSQPTPITSNPWSKFDTTSSSQWDKFGTRQKPTPTAWDKITPPQKQEPPSIIPDENIWQKFEKVWEKFTNSISSVFNTIASWFK